MTDAPASDLARRYRRTHDRVIAVASDLSDDQLRRRLERTNSIAFNVWHLARWADHLQSILSTSTPPMRERLGERAEIWVAEGLARRWGFDTGALGAVETGMGMDEDASAELPLPAAGELLAYARRAFAAAGEMVDAVAAGGDAEMCLSVSIDPARIPWVAPSERQGTVFGWVMAYWEHDNRHLGMIEAIRGVLGVRGTATA